MTTLTIEDLPVSEELDSAAMAAVQGGNTLGQTIIGQNLSVFEMDDKKSGGGGKGGGTKSNSGALEYVTLNLESVVVTGG